LSGLPRISGREAIAALAKAGFEKDRQKGSHVVLRHHSPPYRRIAASLFPIIASWQPEPLEQSSGRLA
jgi:hypothetical protein